MFSVIIVGFTTFIVNLSILSARRVDCVFNLHSLNRCTNSNVRKPNNTIFVQQQYEDKNYKFEMSLFWVGPEETVHIYSGLILKGLTIPCHLNRSDVTKQLDMCELS